MVRQVSAALVEWQQDPRVHAVVLTAAGGKAFCAGGDVREIRRLVLEGEFDEIERFFSEEYALNLLIARYPKPYISVIAGICMGGGIGLSVHGGIRVATETASFAMPETAIGLFPDIGASFILPRLRGCWGMYLGLTGLRVGGAESVRVGLCTHFVGNADLPALMEALTQDGPSVLAGFAQPLPPSPDPDGLSAFNHSALADILAAATEPARASLAKVSPSALAWTHELLLRGAGLTLEQCQAMELELTRHVVRHPDFAEGVRAMVVDKDRAPRWHPPTIEAVDPKAIAAMFAPG